MDGNSHDIRQAVIARAIHNAYGIIMLDHYLARRKRVHIGWRPDTDDQVESVELIEVLEWLRQGGAKGAVFVSGHRTRPQYHYIYRWEDRT